MALQVNPKFLNNNTTNNNKVRTSSTNTNKLSVNPKFLQSNIPTTEMSAVSIPQTPTQNAFNILNKANKVQSYNDVTKPVQNRMAEPAVSQNVPTFKTLEEAQQYAKNNNMNVISPSKEQVKQFEVRNKVQPSDKGMVIQLNKEDKNFYLSDNRLNIYKNSMELAENSVKLAEERYNNASESEKELALQELNKAKEKYQEKLKDYTTAVKYDEYYNPLGKHLRNIAGSVSQGVANVGNYLGRTLEENRNASIGNSYDNIDADALYKYLQNPNDISLRTKGFNSLIVLDGKARTSENAKKLFEELTSGNFKGSAKDLEERIESIRKQDNEDKKIMKNTYDYVETNDEIIQNMNLSDTEKTVYDAEKVIGNMLPTIGAGAINPALGRTTLFANANESAFNEALRDGASYNQAENYGNIVGGIELGSEMLFDSTVGKAIGLGGLSSSEPYANYLGNIATNKFGKTIGNVVRGGTNFAGDLLGEGVEEVVSEFANPFAKMATYDPNAPLATPEQLDKAFTSSLLPTAILGGGAQAINSVNNAINNQQPTQTVTPQSPNTRIQQQTNEVITQQNENGQNANIVQNNINNQKVDNRPTLDLRKIAQSYIEEGNISEQDKQILRETINSATDEEIDGDLLYGLRNTIKEQEQKNALYGQNNTQIAQNTPNNVQISQNNAQNLQKTGQNNAKAEIVYNKDGSFNKVKIKENIFENKGNKSIAQTIKQYLTKHIGEYADIIESGQRVYLGEDLPGEYTYSKSAQSLNKTELLAKGRATSGLKEIINNATNRQYEPNRKDKHNVDAKYGFYRYDTTFAFEHNGKEQNYTGTILIRNDADGKKYLYDILNIKKIGSNLPPATSNSQKSSVVNGGSNSVPVNNIIQSNENYVNNNLPTQAEQQQAQQELRDKLPTEESRLNMKKPKLEDIAELTEKDAQLPTMTYKQKADKNTPYRRKFWDNVESSKIVSKDVKEQVNMTNYERKHNNDVLEKMKDRLDTEPMKVAQEWFRKDIKKATEQDVALGAILLERYQAEGRIEEAIDVVEKLADMGTEAGRTVQMYSIFQRLTPEGMMMYQQRKLNSALETLTQKQTGKWVEQNKDKFKLTEDDATFITAKVQEAQNAPTERQKQIALAEIENRINDKLPPEAGQSIKAFRRIAMLFNPKTQVRNVVGNITVMPLNYVTDLVGTAIDKAVAKKTGIRTTTLPNVKIIGKGFVKGASETIDDYRRGIRTTPTGSRYEIQNNAKSFNENTDSRVKNAINNKLNAIDRILSTTLELGDRPFYEAAYQNALEGQMKANNVTEPTQEMIDIASNVALSQTWQDNNNYTQAVLGIRSAFNKINIKGFGLGDLIIPFAKTPANLTKAMVDYSPAGLISSVINYNDMRKAISRGDMTPMQQKKFVTSVGKAVAGTMLYAIAGALVQSGAVTGSSDEDKDVANFEKNVLGIQPYSIKIGDKTFTYNWAQPLATPFAIMADTKKMTEEGAEWNEILVNAFKVAGDQLVANSFLQGIQELLSSEYGNESAMDNLVGAIMDLPTQFTPTLLGQIATQFDATKRQTFENGDTVGTMLNEVKNKIPGAKNTLAPQVNTFGEEIQNYGGDNNPFNVFLNPGNISSANATDTQKELYKLYQDTKDKTVFPAQAPYSVSGSGQKVILSSKDRANYQKTSGKFASENLEALFDSEYYKSLDNGKKAEVVTEIVTDANTLAKGEYLETKASKELKEKLSKLGDIPYVEYYNAWSSTRGIETDKNWKGESISGSKKKKQIQAVNNAVSKDLTIKQRETLYGLVGISGY